MADPNSQTFRFIAEKLRVENQALVDTITSLRAQLDAARLHADRATTASVAGTEYSSRQPSRSPPTAARFETSLRSSDDDLHTTHHRVIPITKVRQEWVFQKQAAKPKQATDEQTSIIRNQRERIAFLEAQARTDAEEKRKIISDYEGKLQDLNRKLNRAQSALKQQQQHIPS